MASSHCVRWIDKVLDLGATHGAYFPVPLDINWYFRLIPSSSSAYLLCCAINIHTYIHDCDENTYILGVKKSKRKGVFCWYVTMYVCISEFVYPNLIRSSELEI